MSDPELSGADAGARDIEPVHPTLRAFLQRLPELVAASQPSPFWEEQLRDHRHVYDRAPELDGADVAALVRDAGYGFEPLPDDIRSPAEDPAFKAALKSAAKGARRDTQPSPETLKLDEPAWRHMRALHFLRKEHLLDEYVSFLEPLRIRSSLAVARHWFYARQLAQLADATFGRRRLDVLEIGAGAGNLAFFLTRMKRVRSYCIVDLPEMLVHSAYTLQRYLPAKRRFAFDKPALAGEEGLYLFLPAARAGKLAKRTFDLVLNLNSFMEMDEKQRNDYIEIAYRSGRDGALFYNVNRRQRALPTPGGGHWDSNPLLYPYRRDDQVLIWEEDPFQTVTRSKWGGSVSLAVTRAAIIRPARAASPAP
jgi:SAM-dependent methyltransferase